MSSNIAPYLLSNEYTNCANGTTMISVIAGIHTYQRGSCVRA